MNPASVDIKNFLTGLPGIPADWALSIGREDTVDGTKGTVRLVDIGAWQNYHATLKQEHPTVRISVERKLNSTASYEEAYALAHSIRNEIVEDFLTSSPGYEGVSVEGDISNTHDALDIFSIEVRLLRTAA